MKEVNVGNGADDNTILTTRTTATTAASSSMSPNLEKTNPKNYNTTVSDTPENSIMKSTLATTNSTEQQKLQVSSATASRGRPQEQTPRRSEESISSLSLSCPSIYEDEHFQNFTMDPSSLPAPSQPAPPPPPRPSPLHGERRSASLPPLREVHFPGEDELVIEHQYDNPSASLPPITTTSRSIMVHDDISEELSEQSEPAISHNNTHKRRSIRSFRRKARKSLTRMFSSLSFSKNTTSSSTSSNKNKSRDMLSHVSEPHTFRTRSLFVGKRSRRQQQQQQQQASLNDESSFSSIKNEQEHFKSLSQSEPHPRTNNRYSQDGGPLQSFDDTYNTFRKGYTRPALTTASTRLSISNIERIDNSLSEHSALLDASQDGNHSNNHNHTYHHNHDSHSLRNEPSFRKRGAITTAYIAQSEKFLNYHDFERYERCKEWMSSFRRSDPRYRVLKYFHDVAQDGCDNIEEKGIDPLLVSPLLRMFYHASVFTVWRPTRIAAIRKMMGRQAVGKGLDIKGKSAVQGKLSGYVPYVQISETEHKRLIQSIPRTAKMRIYFPTEQARATAQQALDAVALDMARGYRLAKHKLSESTMALLKDPSQTFETAINQAKEIEPDGSVTTPMVEQMKKYMWDVSDYRIVPINNYAPESYGLELSQRVVWEAYVMRNTIEREPGSPDDTGRPSEPAFMDMNNASVRSMPKYPCDPRAVVWQMEKSNPMCPLNLVMAYEEDNRVLPVASDFDCFLVGTRGVKFQKPLPPEQVECMKTCIANIEKILDSPHRSESWTRQWVKVLKEKKDPTSTTPPQIPRFGFGDPKSYSIMEHAIKNLKDDGCVRHGAECFNYTFPQELDDLFLVISDYPLEGTDLSWKYVNVNELQSILLQRIDQGYTFPLNPKWILCDPGWKRVYDKLFASPKTNVAQSLDVWYPPDSGIREEIQSIYSRHSDGFLRRAKEPGTVVAGSNQTETKYGGASERDLAEFELDKHVNSASGIKKVKKAVKIINERNKQEAGRLVATARWKVGSTEEEEEEEEEPKTMQKEKSPDGDHKAVEDAGDCRVSATSLDAHLELSEYRQNLVSSLKD